MSTINKLHITYHKLKVPIIKKYNSALNSKAISLKPQNIIRFVNWELKLGFILLFIFNINIIYAQIFPLINDNLNYTQVMFEYPEIKNTSYYCIQIAENPSKEKFENNITLKQNDSTTATLVNGLKFGSKYQWRYIAYNNNNEIIYTSRIFMFRINSLLNYNKDTYRFTINKSIPDDGLLLLDGSGIAINRKGEPVWFLPYDSITTRCLKMTKQGTIIYIADDKNGKKIGTEINIKGKILWKTPNSNKKLHGDSANSYHHEITKLNNGNYMIMLDRYVDAYNKFNAKKILYASIIEFDKRNKIIWQWNSEKYINDSDLYDSDNFYNYNPKSKKRDVFDAGHINGFYFDELNNIIYISVRNISRIIKIDRNTGKILANYGDKMYSGDAKYANGFFKYMHSPTLLPNGNIAVFSNNQIELKNSETTPASAVIFSEPKTLNDKSEKIWEFKCNFDTLYNDYSISSGNVEYLDNKNLIVNMGNPVSRIFEVTPEKEIVWDCYSEVYNKNKSIWIESYNYRMNYIKSLYPIYFTINNSMNKDTINFDKSLKIAFKINNEGSSNDSYIIKYYINNTEYMFINTDTVSPHNTIDIDMNIMKDYIKNKNIFISVCSSTNPDYKKKIKFYIK